MTVSRVFSGQNTVAERTRERILEVARQLGYRPNHVARSLVRARTRTLGLILDDSLWFGQALGGIEAISQEFGYAFLQTAAHYGAEIEQQRIETLRERQVEGLLMLSPSDIHDHNHLRALHQAGLPLVTINRYCEEMGFWRLFFAFRSATYAVTRRLIAAGHRHIVLVGGAPDHPQGSVRERIAGYRQAMQEAGLGIEEAELVGGMLARDGELLASDVLRRCPKATALLAINDLLASGMLRALRRAGLRLPEDMAVVSLHDTMIGECTDPTLTAIEHSAREAGREGCRLLIEQIEEPDRPTGTLVLPASLVVRQSCVFGSASAAEERIVLEPCATA